MAKTSNWSSEARKDSEEETPVPPYSRCTAIRDFIGEQPQDLSFRCGEQLTIIEPCNVMYWYLAENREGKRGVMPINFVQLHSNPRKSGASVKSSQTSPRKPQPQHSKGLDSLKSASIDAPPPPLPPKPTSSVSTASRHSQPARIPVPQPTALPPHTVSDQTVDIDSRPPAPLPPEAGNKGALIPSYGPTKYQTQKEFLEKSGWFTPSLESVLCKKAIINWSSLTATTSALYLFLHKSEEKKRFIGKSRNCYHELVQMFHRLFEKPESKLSPIEAELKYSNPDADNWHFRLYPLPFPDNLEAELNYKIVHHGTLHPQGLNPEIKFTSKEQFYIFAENYVKFMRERSKSKKTEYSSLTKSKQ